MAGAQPAARIYRVGLMASGTATAGAGMVEALREGLRELGWVEDRNIVAAPSPAVLAARNATTAIVIANVADPVGLGPVASLARPGGNVSGLSCGFDFDVLGKPLQLLEEAVPAARRIAVLSNPANPSHAGAVSGVQAAAMTRARAEALLVVSDSLFGSHAARLAALATRSRLPSMHGARSNLHEGGLTFYGPKPRAPAAASGHVRGGIREGARPAELPVEQPTTFALIVNLGTARALGLTIPPSLRLRVDQVIE